MERVEGKLSGGGGALGWFWKVGLGAPCQPDDRRRGHISGFVRNSPWHSEALLGAGLSWQGERVLF